jgi:hypothetical protein
MEFLSRMYPHYKFRINITLALHVIISQFKKCLSFEVEAVKKAFATLVAKYNQPGAQLKLIFVVVGKRYHTRFYPKDEHQSYGGGRGFDDRDRPVNGNVKPGLLITKDVTTPHSSNFYLQSHSAPAGTARSAHYHVLLDEMEFGSNDQRLADITNTFCYCFPRATKGASYAAPAYIADRMCERGRTWLKPWTPDRAFRLPPTNNGIP